MRKPFCTRQRFIRMPGMPFHTLAGKESRFEAKQKIREGMPLHLISEGTNLNAKKLSGSLPLPGRKNPRQSNPGFRQFSWFPGHRAREPDLPLPCRRMEREGKRLGKQYV
jgi:hypothetical protein